MDQNAHFNDPVLNHVRKDFSLLQDKLTVQEAFEVIRQKGVGEKIIYFYVTDESGKLTGVLPTRRLLISQPDTQISEIMVSRVVAIPSEASVLDACEFFVLYKYLAFPVIDKEHHIVGVVDISLFAEELLDAPDPRQLDDVFEAIGFRITQVRHASPFMAWRYRFPWLLTTIASGTACALLAGMYEATLAQSLVLAFFLTLVLGLGESLSIQAMTMTIQALHTVQPTLKMYVKSLGREAITTFLIGLSCSLVVCTIVLLWMGVSVAIPVIGGSILLSLMSAGTLGVSIPFLLHALKLDPKIAAGPLTLALADICTLLFYFTMADAFLGEQARAF